MLPQAGVIQKDKSIRTVFLQGLVASAAPMFFASIAERWKTTTVFVLNDNDEAGYFYNDLKTIAMPADATLLNYTLLLPSKLSTLFVIITLWYKVNCLK